MLLEAGPTEVAGSCRLRESRWERNRELSEGAVECNMVWIIGQDENCRTIGRTCTRRLNVHRWTILSKGTKSRRGFV